MRPPTLGLTFLLLVQAWSVSAQGPSAERFEPGQIQFLKTHFPDVHEGYVSLQWDDILSDRMSASRYQVYDQDNSVVYRGSLPMAFVSGLADGEYEFWVEAIDADGKLLARSTEPARVEVEHWSLSQAMLLFGIGLTVFLFLVAVIVHGTLSQGTRSDRSSAQAGNQEVNP